MLTSFNPCSFINKNMSEKLLWTKGLQWKQLFRNVHKEMAQYIYWAWIKPSCLPLFSFDRPKFSLRIVIMGLFHIGYMETSGEHVTPTNQRSKSIFRNTSCEADLAQRNFVSRYVCARRQESAPESQSPRAVRNEPGFWPWLFKRYRDLWRGKHWGPGGSSLLSGMEGDKLSTKACSIQVLCFFFSYKDGSHYFLKHVVSMVHTWLMTKNSFSPRHISTLV